MKKTYPYLSLAQLLASLLVILVHCGRLSEIPWLHFLLKSIFCRMAVPFFLVINGFFYRQRQKTQPDYWYVFFRQQYKTYRYLSWVYLPYGLFILYERQVSLLLLPFAIVWGLLFLGVCYHLWYFPALLFATRLTEKLLQHIGYLGSFALFLTLYAIGSYETYSAYFSHSAVEPVYQLYRSVFFTTRNGLFFAPIFIWLGFFLQDNYQKPFFKQQLPLKLFFSGLFVSGEGWLIYHNQGDDKNFLFSLIPLLLIVVPCLLKPQLTRLPDQKFRAIGKELFFWHPAVLELIKISFLTSRGIVIQGLPLFILTVFFTGTLLYLKKLRQQLDVQKPKKALLK